MEIRDMETQNTDKKKILIIQGGGRPHGNTAQLVRSFAEGAEAAGHHTEILSLMKQEVKGCLGCNACRYGKPCIQKDSFNELVPKIKEADLLVFASPIFLDDLIAAQGVYRAVLLYCRKGSGPAKGEI